MISNSLLLTTLFPLFLLAALAALQCDPKSMAFEVSLYFVNFESKSYILPMSLP